MRFRRIAARFEFGGGIGDLRPDDGEAGWRFDRERLMAWRVTRREEKCDDSCNFAITVNLTDKDAFRRDPAFDCVVRCSRDLVFAR